MTVCGLIYLYPLNTQVLPAVGLQDSVTLLYLNSATVTATLVDEHGNIDQVINNLPMAYVANSNGCYNGIVPATFNASLGGGYSLVVVANQAGVQAYFTFPVEVRLRTKTP